MAEDFAAAWEARLHAIASSLLKLEVTTLVKDGVVGQKMPEIPIALHEIGQAYRDFLAGSGLALPERVLVAACGRLLDTEAYTDFLRAWAGGEPAPPWPGLDSLDPGDGAAGMLTNGAETFEALFWAARRLRGSGAADRQSAALLTRIEANCLQLCPAAIVLEEAFSSAGPGADPVRRARIQAMQSSTLPYRDRLRAEMLARAQASPPGQSRLFGGTTEETSQALFREPRPVIPIEPDLVLLIRKIWNLGLDEVVLQTTIQIDGDVLVRVAEPPADGQEFLFQLHRNAVADGVQQWGLMFAALRAFASLLVDALAGSGRAL